TGDVAESEVIQQPATGRVSRGRDRHPERPDQRRAASRAAEGEDHESIPGRVVDDPGIEYEVAGVEEGGETRAGHQEAVLVEDADREVRDLHQMVLTYRQVVVRREASRLSLVRRREVDKLERGWCVARRSCRRQVALRRPETRRRARAMRRAC